MAAPGSPIRDFCARVCAQVRFTPDRAAISAELAAHLEDRADALRERDPALTPEEAQARAVAAMGDPEAIGRALNQSHSPLLGWFQVWFRRAVWSLAAMVLLVSLPQTVQTLTALAAPPVFQETAGLGHLLAHYDEYDVTADLVPLVVDRTDNGLILVISNASEIVRTEVVFPASDEGDTGFYLLSADQVRRAENCFLFSYSMSGLCAHYPEDLQVRGYNAAGALVYQSPVPESWESRYELR